MQLRAAIRYAEYKAADKLPRSIPDDCAECIDKGWPEKFNCGGGEKTNEKYTVMIGTMEFDQCPRSVPSQEAWDIIELIRTWEETGTPIVGHCLMDQTRETFKYRRIINSEKNECQKELSDLHKQDMDRKQRSASLVKSFPARGRVR